MNVNIVWNFKDLNRKTRLILALKEYLIALPANTTVFVVNKSWHCW